MMFIAALGILVGLQAKPASAIVTRAEGKGDPALGRRFSEGARIVLAVGQKRTILHLATGARVSLSGPTEYLVSSKGLIHKAGALGQALVPLKTPVKPIRSRDSRDSNKAPRRAGAVVVRGGADDDPGPHSISPRGGLFPDQTTIKWRGYIDGDSLSVSLVKDRREVFATTLKAKDKEFTLPASARTPGETFTLTLTVLRDGRFVSSDRITYSFLTQEARDEVTALEESFGEAAKAGDIEAMLILLDCMAEWRLASRAEPLAAALQKAELSSEERERLAELLEEISQPPSNNP